MFDTFNGLPVHILVVHAVVVLVPLMSLVTIAFTIRPKWRPGLGWAVLGNAVALGTAFVAKEAGEQLERRLNLGGQDLIADHVYHGDRLPLFVAGLLVASVIAWALTRRDSKILLAVAVLVTVVAGAVATQQTVKTGESGSKAVWADIVTSTN